MKNITRAELRKEFRSLNSKLKRRLNNIRELGGNLADQTAVRKYNDLIMDGVLPRDISDLSDKELRKLVSQLRYINSLKTSTVKGAVKTKSQWQEAVKDKLDFENNEELQDKFYDALSRATEQPHQEQFKYQIAGVIADILVEKPDIDVERIMSELDEAFMNATLKSKGSTISGTKLEREFGYIRTRYSGHNR